MDPQRLQLEAQNVEARAVACLAGLVPHGDDEALHLVRVLAQLTAALCLEVQRRGERLRALEELLAGDGR